MPQVSTQPNILIITHNKDNECAARVMHRVSKLGGKAFRFDTDDFPTRSQLSVYYSGKRENVRLVTDKFELDLNSVSAVWYRRVAIGHNIPKSMDKQLRQASINESGVTIQGMIASLDAFHLDPVHRIRRAENKQLQLKIARSMGIDTPRSLTTNDPAAVRQFANECEQSLVMKTLSSFSIYEEGEQMVVFTNRLQARDLDHLDELRFGPVTFQEHVPKALELRTTIVGDKLFTASIDSQKSCRSRFDWRRDGIGLINDWQRYQLPDEVQTKLLKLMDFFGLNYGAADFIVTPDGRHVFLEVNPSGEFYWLERNPGFEISGTLAKLLVAGRGAR